MKSLKFLIELANLQVINISFNQINEEVSLSDIAKKFYIFEDKTLLNG